MSARPRRTEKSVNHVVACKVGDYVLMGSPKYSYPDEWLLARAIFADAATVLTEHSPAGGSTTQRNIYDADHVRFAGEYSDVRRYQDLIREQTRPYRDRINAAQEAEHKAASERENAWREMAECVAKIERGEAA